MYYLYLVMISVHVVPMGVGIWNFRRLSQTHKVFTVGASCLLLLWLISFVISRFKLGSTHPLHYIKPLIYSIFFWRFYYEVFRDYPVRRFLVAFPLIVFSYTFFDLYHFGIRILAIDLLSYANVFVFVLGSALLYVQLNSQYNLGRSSLFWLNLAIVVNAFFDIASNFLLNRLYQYQTNDWFNLVYYGFWAVFGFAYVGLLIYSYLLELAKRPGLEKFPNLEN